MKREVNNVAENITITTHREGLIIINVIAEIYVPEETNENGLKYEDGYISIVQDSSGKVIVHNDGVETGLSTLSFAINQLKNTVQYWEDKKKRLNETEELIEYLEEQITLNKADGIETEESRLETLERLKVERQNLQNL